MTLYNPTNLNNVAYVAGLFDGEGCIYISAPTPKSPPRKFQLLVHISNNYRPIIDALHQVYGGQIQRIITARKNVNFTIHWRSQKAATFLKTVHPHLLIKRDQADLALAFQAHMSPKGRSRLVTSGDIDYRWFCHHEMKRLKQAYFEPVERSPKFGDK